MASSSGCALGAGASLWPGVVGRGASASRSESARPDERFPRSCRLTRRQQFLDVYGRAPRVASRSFVLFGLPNDLPHCRLGLTVTRKVGGSVRRNRVKRVLREVFRRHRRELDLPLDLVVNARPSIVERSFAELERELLESFARLARLVRGRNPERPR